MRIASLMLSTGMLAALPFAAQADQRCEHSAPRDAELRLSGIKTVMFDIGPHALTLNGGKNTTGAIRGKACTSDTKRLVELVVNQQREGDKQSPEGFYTIGAPQMRHRGRWQRAFNLGYPNLHDKTLRRSGSYILVHGGCSSTGCYAMTEPAQNEIHRLASAALRGVIARAQRST